MLKVRVGSRNRGTLCRRCGRRLGEVATYAFRTRTGRTFCGDCGKALQDSTVTAAKGGRGESGLPQKLQSITRRSGSPHNYPSAIKCGAGALETSLSREGGRDE